MKLASAYMQISNPFSTFSFTIFCCLLYQCRQTIQEY